MRLIGKLRILNTNSIINYLVLQMFIICLGLFALQWGRNSIFWGLYYSFWIGSFLVPAYKYQKIEEGVNPDDLVSDNFIIVIFLVSAFILGLGAAPLWVSQ